MHLSNPPSAIQARMVLSKKPYQYGNDTVTINPDHGFSCVNKEQPDGRCNDYEIRFCCAPATSKGIFFNVSCI